MSNRSSSSHRISNIFFISILAAAGIYGMAIVIESVSAGDLLPGLITLAILVAAVAATVILRIPNYFGSNFSSTTISLLAIAISILGLLLAITSAADFVGLPDQMMMSPGTQNLRTVSFIGVASFSLALVVNMLAAILVPRRSARPTS